MWKLLGRRDEEPDEEEQAQNALPELETGMFLEVLTMQNRLIFRGRVEDVGDTSIKITDQDGENLPYVEYNTRVKLRGYVDGDAICLVGMIGGSSSRLWKIDRLGTLQTSERRNYFRQNISVEVLATRIEEDDEEEEKEKKEGEETPQEPVPEKKLYQLPCRMLDISAGGAMLFAKGILAVGDKVSIKNVVLMKNEPPFDFTGVIRRAIKREDIWEYGCEFTGLTSKQQERLIRVIMLLQRKELQARCGRA